MYLGRMDPKLFHAGDVLLSGGLVGLEAEGVARDGGEAFEAERFRFGAPARRGSGGRDGRGRGGVRGLEEVVDLLIVDFGICEVGSVSTATGPRNGERRTGDEDGVLVVVVDGNDCDEDSLGRNLKHPG